MKEKGSNSWNDIYKYTDYAMLVVTVVLFLLGVLAIHSASYVESNPLPVSTFAVKQLIWGGISAVAYVLVLKIGYGKFMEYTAPLFALTVLLFILLLVMGHTSKGAQSWFNLGIIRFQPSEPGKVVFAMALALLAVKFPPTSFKNMLPLCMCAGFLILLIILQPDLGSCLVYMCMTYVVLIVAGAPARILWGIIGAGIAALPVFWMILKPYQKLRLLVFINPAIDPQGAGYNVIQSRIAVGSGGLFGKGFLHGTQGRLHFLPEPHTDFIFSVFSEEFGFIGSTAVLILFFILLSRMISTAFYTRDMKAKVFVSAITAWIWFQIFESVAMSMGLAPVTGLPLPLFSYGGSSLLAVVIAFAMVQSVAIAERKKRF